MAGSFLDLVDVVDSYYGGIAGGTISDQAAYIFQNGVSTTEAVNILKQTPGVDLVLSQDESRVLSWSIRDTTAARSFPVDAGAVANSNANAALHAGSTGALNVPGSTGAISQETITAATTGAKQVSTGATIQSTVATVGQAVAAAAVGITLGKTIDAVLYNANPDFWDAHGMSSINPDTWASITSGDDSLNAALFNMIFGITPESDTVQTYLPEDAFAYLALYMQSKGVFSETYENMEPPVIVPPSTYVRQEITSFEPVAITLNRMISYGDDRAKMLSKFYNDIIAEAESIGADSIFCWDTQPGPTSLMRLFILKTNSPTEFTSTGWNQAGVGTFIWILTTQNTLWRDYKRNYSASQGTPYIQNAQTSTGTYINGTIVTIPGINTQTGARLPDLSGVTTPSDALTALKQQYPELWGKAISTDVPQPDGTVKTIVYVPVGFPDGISSLTDTTPTATPEGTSQSHPGVTPESSPAIQSIFADLLGQITDSPSDSENTPTTGTGTTPPVIIPVGSASALYGIYNPSESQVQQFGAWLWSSNFVDQLLKLFSDPMQAIIGLHKVFAPPVISGQGTIKAGYLDSGVPSNIVGSQYVTVDCGKVNVFEYFGNVFDYSGNTDISIYLPFVGIVPLNVDDVMRGSVQVIYRVDVLTGAILADVRVTRDGNQGGTLYQYSADGAVHYPLSSGNYLGIVAGIAGAAVSAFSGNLMGVAGSLGSMRTRVERSGGFSGNSGAMGAKVPYLIISRPQTAIANAQESLIGIPANYHTILGSLSGYVKVLECNLENIPATGDELSEIEDILKNGVII